MIQSRGYDYVCQPLENKRLHCREDGGEVCRIKTQSKDTISLERVKSGKTTDYLLKVNNPGKAAKEASMNNQFKCRFLQEIGKIKASLSRKSGVKKTDKVERRIGRTIEKYPSAAKSFNIEVISEKGIATDIALTKKEDINDRHPGIYFIRTCLKPENEHIVWIIYNTIREIESVFRCLKTDLDLRPIYHKSDDATLAHLHLGLLAYWLVNTIIG